MEDILYSSEIEPVGMLFPNDDFEWNMYYFNHAIESCGSTFVIPVREFLHLIDEPIPDTVLNGTDRCDGHCVSVTDIRECSQSCHYAPFRRFMLDLLSGRRSKAATPPSSSPKRFDV